MQEIWMDIPNYKGYQVSNFGRIRTFDKITYTKRHGERHWENRILKQKIQTRKDGRKDARVELWNNGNHKTFLVSRLIAFTFYNEDINNINLTVNHKDGDSLNNRLDNLELISLADNIRHAFDTGLNKTCITITLINKETCEVQKYRSLQKASLMIGRNHGYLSNCIKKNKYENEKYKWEVS